MALLASVASLSRLGSVQDADPDEILVAVAQENTLVGEKLCISGLLGSLETNVKHVRFLIIIDPSFALRQTD